jgi:multiple sugar transport system substrate-binding protein
MTELSRRSLLQAGTTLAAGGMLAGSGLTEWASAWAQTSQWKPEPKAQLSLLRWKRFIQAEEDAFMAIVNAFTKTYGVPVKVANESLDDVQPKASVAANTGQGPDLFWGLYSLPHLFPQKCLDVGDIAKYLGDKYGGWTPSSELYGKNKNKWVALTVGYNANVLNYRISALQKAGFTEFPKTTDEFLAFVTAAKKNGQGGGMALGHASGDGNAWVHWCLWAFGGYLVDKDDKVIINSPETAKALDYAKKLAEGFVPGTASWTDASNNKAFLAGEVAWTNNGVSIYVTAQNEKPDIAADMDHANWPVGPVGKPTEFHLAYPMMAMNYTKFPQACKTFMAFLMDAPQYNGWLQGSRGYLSHPLNAYDANPVWKSDPKITVARDAGRRTLAAGHLGSVGEKAAAAIADFIVLDMFANVCTGREDVKAAMAMAERQAKRIYR